MNIRGTFEIRLEPVSSDSVGEAQMIKVQEAVQIASEMLKTMVPLAIPETILLEEVEATHDDVKHWTVSLSFSIPTEKRSTTFPQLAALQPSVIRVAKRFTLNEDGDFISMKDM